MMKHLIWWWRLKLHGRLPWGLEGHYIRVALSLMISIAGHVNSYLRRRWSILPSSNGFPSLIIRKQCCCRNYFRGEENRPNITTWRQDTRFWESFVLCTAQHLLNQMMMLAFTTLESRIIVHARNMYFEEISTMHGLIRDMHEPNFSTFQPFFWIFWYFLYILTCILWA